MTRPHRMIRRQPADRWQDALPTGNGTIGALAYGSIRNETILLNHKMLWLWSDPPQVVDVSAHLTEVRSLLLDGRFDEATSFLHNRLMENGCEPKRPDPYQPAFDLKVDTATSAAFSHYSSEVDFATGEVTAKWEEQGVSFWRKLFVSRPDDVVVLVVRASEPGQVNCTFRLAKCQHEGFGMGAHRERGGEERVEVEAWTEGGWLALRGRQTVVSRLYPDGNEFGGIGQVVTTSGRVQTQDGVVRVRDADEVLLLLKLFANEPADAALPRLRTAIGELPGEYDELLSRHVKLHGHIFARMTLDLGGDDRSRPNESLLADAYEGDVPTALIERMFDYGRYLLICSSLPYTCMVSGEK